MTTRTKKKQAAAPAPLPPGLVLSPNEAWTLYLCSLRYAMGRRSYIVGDIVDLYSRVAPHLTRPQREQVASEIREELRRAAQTGSTLGHDIDHADWTLLAERIEAELKKEGGKA